MNQYAIRRTTTIMGVKKLLNKQFHLKCLCWLQDMLLVHGMN